MPWLFLLVCVFFTSGLGFVISFNEPLTITASSVAQATATWSRQLPFDAVTFTLQVKGQAGEDGQPITIDSQSKTTGQVVLAFPTAGIFNVEGRRLDPDILIGSSNDIQVLAGNNLDTSNPQPSSTSPVSPAATPTQASPTPFGNPTQQTQEDPAATTTVASTIISSLVSPSPTIISASVSSSSTITPAALSTAIPDTSSSASVDILSSASPSTSFTSLTTEIAASQSISLSDDIPSSSALDTGIVKLTQSFDPDQNAQGSSPTSLADPDTSSSTPRSTSDAIRVIVALVVTAVILAIAALFVFCMRRRYRQRTRHRTADFYRDMMVRSHHSRIITDLAVGEKEVTSWHENGNPQVPPPSRSEPHPRASKIRRKPPPAPIEELPSYTEPQLLDQILPIHQDLPLPTQPEPSLAHQSNMDHPPTTPASADSGSVVFARPRLPPLPPRAVTIHSYTPAMPAVTSTFSWFTFPKPSLPKVPQFSPLQMSFATIDKAV